MDKEILFNWIYENCLEYGNFTLKSGKKSNYYIDLRKAFSCPKILSSISKYLSVLIQNIMSETNLSINDYKIIGIPYGGIPYATHISTILNKSLLLVRKENKKHGTKKVIEGNYKKGDRVILIEDTITTGKSVTETINKITREGLLVSGVVSIINRGGLSTIRDNLNINVSSLFDINDFVKTKENIIKKLLNFKKTKNSNLIFSADIDDPEEMLKKVEQVAKHIIGVKLHIDIYPNPLKILKKVWKLSKKHNFIVIEDRKFADISHTTKKQLCLINKYIDIATTHLISGEGILEAFREYNLTCLPISEMSTINNLITPLYTQSVYKISQKYKDIVLGFICQKPPLFPEFISFIPGINLEVSKDGDQKYQKPNGDINNYYIVGRGIYHSDDLEKSAEKYKKYCMCTKK